MKFKKISTLFLVTIISISIVGCSKTDSNIESSTIQTYEEEYNEKGFKIGYENILEFENKEPIERFTFKPFEELKSKFNSSEIKSTYNDNLYKIEDNEKSYIGISLENDLSTIKDIKTVIEFSSKIEDFNNEDLQKEIEHYKVALKEIYDIMFEDKSEYYLERTMNMLSELDYKDLKYNTGTFSIYKNYDDFDYKDRSIHTILTEDEDDKTKTISIIIK